MVLLFEELMLLVSEVEVAGEALPPRTSKSFDWIVDLVNECEQLSTIAIVDNQQ